MTSAKHRRESKLLMELQRDHGYMLAQMPSERDRTTTQVRGVGQKHMTMTPARVVRLIVPESSSLGKELRLAPAPKRSRRRTMRKP